jgi:hypothetical protein
MQERDESEGLGGMFWLKLIGAVLAGGVVVMMLFGVFGRAWYAWGILGALLFMGLLAMGFGFAYDRREQKRRSGIVT